MNSSILLSENILFRRVAGEGVVVDQQDGKVLVVNEMAIRILELCRELGTIESVVESITKEYDVLHEVIEKDAVELLQQLNKAAEEGN